MTHCCEPDCNRLAEGSTGFCRTHNDIIDRVLTLELARSDSGS